MEPLGYLTIFIVLGLMLGFSERNPRIRRSLRQQVAIAAAFLLVFLVLQAVGIEQPAAFAATYVAFAAGMVALFALQRVRRTT